LDQKRKIRDRPSPRLMKKSPFACLPACLRRLAILRWLFFLSMPTHDLIDGLLNEDLSTEFEERSPRKPGDESVLFMYTC
jgi:hypothetical protein